MFYVEVPFFIACCLVHIAFIFKRLNDILVVHSADIRPVLRAFFVALAEGF